MGINGIGGNQMIPLCAQGVVLHIGTNQDVMRLKMTSYLEKLKDPRWQKKRLEIFQRDNWKCVECGDDKSTLHVHHEEYSSSDPWNTVNDKLKTLCDNCHSKKGSKINQIESFLEKIGVEFRIIPVWQNDGDEERYLINISDL